MNRSALAVSLLLLVLAGCGSKAPLLVPKDPEPPQAVSFSGLWQLRPGFADTNRRIEELAGRASRDGGLIRTRTPDGEGRGRRQRKGSLMHVFLETGSALKITQTDYALFISFDRAVVEEYEFGEHGIVSIGEVTAERAAGWEGERFVIETADDEGARLSETYMLGGDGEVLVRSVSLLYRKQPPVELQQVFDRVE